MKPYPPLLDAAGNIVPVDECVCGRPKEAGKPACCRLCGFWDGRQDLTHSSACNIRCATRSVPGFSARLVPEHKIPGEPIYVSAKNRLTPRTSS